MEMAEITKGGPSLREIESWRWLTLLGVARPYHYSLSESKGKKVSSTKAYP